MHTPLFCGTHSREAIINLKIVIESEKQSRTGCRRRNFRITQPCERRNRTELYKHVKSRATLSFRRGRSEVLRIILISDGDTPTARAAPHEALTHTQDTEPHVDSASTRFSSLLSGHSRNCSSSALSPAVEICSLVAHAALSQNIT